MNLTTPGPTVGVVGAGQLGRMLGEAAGPLGVEVVALDPTPDPPAAPVVRDTVTAAFDDEGAIRDLAARADVLTYEIELADPDALERASEATGTPVHPSPDTLRIIEDKLVQKEALADAGVPVPEFVGVADADGIRAAGEELGYPLMLKARTGGYDGRGNAPVEGPEEAEEALLAVTGADDPGEVPTDAAMVEAFVPFERELAVMGARGDGETTTHPVTETIHEAEILRETVAPARTGAGARRRAREVATDVLDLLEGRGIFGIELFELDGDEPRVLVNEIAPRPHNSGHWTIEGALTSQFAQHLRAVLGWPLGATDLRTPTASANVLGAPGDAPRDAELAGVETVLATAGASLHWYGKREVRPLRKMGHLTAVASRRDGDAPAAESAPESGDDGEPESGLPDEGTPAVGVDALLERARDLRDGMEFVSDD